MTTCYDSVMSDNDRLIKFIANTVESLRQRVDTISEQMATKVDLANLRDDLTAMREQMATKEDLEQMASKEDLSSLESRLRNELASKNDLGRLETTMHGEFEQVHIRLDSLDRRIDTRIGQIETDVSRLRSVVYLLVKDKPDMLRLLGQPTPGETRPQS
jgi:hypothetical protein